MIPEGFGDPMNKKVVGNDMAMNGNQSQTRGSTRLRPGSSFYLAFIALGAAGLATVAWAGVPLPDAILYGRITINGQLITASDDVTVIARVDGVANPIGSYKMGQLSPPGDHYVLRNRLEAAVAGSPASTNAAEIGQTAHLFVRQGSTEVFAADVTLSSIATVVNLDLDVLILPANCVADKVVNLADHNAFRDCMSGPGIAVPGTCSCADVDGDGDVDISDWRWLQRSFAGE